MHYDPNDVIRLVHAVPCLKLAKPPGFLRYLSHVVATGLELAPVLSQYPGVRYEPLDFHYVCLQSLGALDDDLLQDLTEHYQWPGILWAALLVALDPRPSYAAILLNARERAPYQAWLVDLALDRVNGIQSVEYPEHLVLLTALAVQLRGAGRTETRLRKIPSLPKVLEHSERVRAAYRVGGADAALKLISKN